MISLAAVLQQVQGLDAATLQVWIAEDWVRPVRKAGQPVFEEIDVARVRLIVELRDTLDVGDGAMPIVLTLLDQLHASRRDLRRLAQRLDGTR